MRRERREYERSGNPCRSGWFEAPLGSQEHFNSLHYGGKGGERKKGRRWYENTDMRGEKGRIGLGEQGRRKRGRTRLEEQGSRERRDERGGQEEG